MKREGEAKRKGREEYGGREKKREGEGEQREEKKKSETVQNNIQAERVRILYNKFCKNHPSPFPRRISLVTRRSGR